MKLRPAAPTKANKSGLSLKQPAWVQASHEDDVDSIDILKSCQKPFVGIVISASGVSDKVPWLEFCSAASGGFANHILSFSRLIYFNKLYNLEHVPLRISQTESHISFAKDPEVRSTLCVHVHKNPYLSIFSFSSSIVSSMVYQLCEHLGLRMRMGNGLAERALMWQRCVFSK